MHKVLQEIADERQRQIDICQHGGDTNKFDETNSQGDWVAYIAAYAGRASNKVYRNMAQNEDFRTNMIKVAALALAAVEAHDKGHC